MPTGRTLRRPFGKTLRCTTVLVASLVAAGTPRALAVPFRPPESGGGTLLLVQARGGLSHSFARAAGSAARSTLAGANRPMRGSSELAGHAQGRTTAPAPGAQSAAEMALGLRNQINRNRVEVERVDGRRSVFDLAGRGHFEKSVSREIPTPHKHSTILHQGPTGQSATRTTVEPMTKQDVRAVRRVIEMRNAGEGGDGR